MKQLNKFSLIVIACLFSISLFAEDEKALTELSKELVEEFTVDDDSQIAMRHRRGDLTVKYIQGNQGRVEATITIKGEDEEDIQTILDALSIEVARKGRSVEIQTANKIVSWSNSIGLFGAKHKLTLKNGKTINTKIDDIDIVATLYLPKVAGISLNTRYDDVIIEDFKSDKLSIDAHSGKVVAGDLMTNTAIKMKYGTLDIQNVDELFLDSHDAKGEIGNIGDLTIKDKYSDLKFGHLKSLDADLHDAEIVFGAVGGDVNIKDKYSVIQLEDMIDGRWHLHDSKVKIRNANKLNITSKYSKIVVQNVLRMDIDCHDDEVSISVIEDLHVSHSKYSKFDISTLEMGLYANNSHDDKFMIDNVASGKFTGFTLNGKYTEVDLPLPDGIGYAIEANMKYGDLEYPEKGLKDLKYIKDGSELEVRAAAADGTNKIRIQIQAHDCKVDLNG